MDAPPAPFSPRRAWLLVGALVVGYIGIYLCRKNFSVAVPLIRAEFGLSKEDIGKIASYSTLAYMVGKFVFGPVIDRVGGRAAFLASLLAVAVFGGLGGLGGSFPMLVLVYSLNRLAGSAGWGGMVKLVADWLPARSLPLAMAVLSLGFVFGGVCATLLAGQVAECSANNWRWVMGGPALVLTAILGGCWLILPRGTPGVASPPTAPADAPSPAAAPAAKFEFRHLRDLLFIRRFWILLALSFVLTLLRETFNTWTVDFFKTVGEGELSTRIAAFLSTPFDACGAAGILSLGWAFGRLAAPGRMRLLVAILGALTVLIWLLPALAGRNLWLATAALGGIGFLAYGPYSLLAGVLAIEIRGKAYVGTVAGVVDGVGYLAAILAGQQFGRILDVGGYRLGFACLAGLAAVAAGLCLFLYRRGEHPGEVAAAPGPDAAPKNVTQS
jgi:sugar phosphate permease